MFRMARKPRIHILGRFYYAMLRGIAGQGRRFSLR